jgi:hypothetical protein
MTAATPTLPPNLPDLASFKRNLQSQPDVLRVLDCATLAGGRVRYFIETPFATFPRFAVGTCSIALEDVEIELTCGAERTAREFFDAQTTTKEKHL